MHISFQYIPSQPHAAYGAQALYPPQILPSIPLSSEVFCVILVNYLFYDYFFLLLKQQPEQINPSHSVSSGSASGEEQQQHTFQQICYNQQQK